MLSEVIPAWGMADEWPRAGVIPQPFFVAVLIAGLALACAGIVLARLHPVTGWLLAFGTYGALLFALDAPGWLDACALPLAVTVFLLAERGPVMRGLWVGGVTLVAGGLVHWVWAVGVAGAPTSEAGLFLVRALAAFAPLVSGGAVLGALHGRQSRRADAVRAEAESLRLDQERRLMQAREGERARVAQELHDVAAQHLAGLLSLADAAVDLSDDDPDTALALVTEVRAEGRFTAASIYGALSDLRSPEGERVAPTPGVGQVADLVDRWSARRTAVELTVVGDATELPLVVSATAYRAVREALANAAKYARGAAISVSVVADPTQLTVTVENGSCHATSRGEVATTGLGWGLAGLRQRAALLGGVLSAGPTEQGGWRVSVQIPLTEPAATEAKAAH
ncbi:sensor histidine kinase [Xylanimonas cellulosilytica]|uniref:sensor histidine kinase n=1 Tax=Xylanimonas cellulosilytica TaxID=186189 RepID=UPI0016518DEE|nr:histidine kinase [Xylanimonas cellulosilytica]